MNFPLIVSPGIKEMGENQSNSRPQDLITGRPGGSVSRTTDDQMQKWWVRFLLRSEISSLPRVWSLISILGRTLRGKFMGSL